MKTGKLKTPCLLGTTSLITGSARRIGRHLALSVAREGGNVIIHHAHSPNEAKAVQLEIKKLGGKAWICQADLSTPEGAEELARSAFSIARVDHLVNNAAIFKNVVFSETSLALWTEHMNVNLTAPFILSKAFANQNPAIDQGRIINIVDWRALRPGSDHFAYTISKAALSAMTISLAAALAPPIIVNAIAFGEVLPPSDGTPAEKFLLHVPSKRLATLDEVSELFLFLLTGPQYITGEIIHLDGGRHLY